MQLGHLPLWLQRKLSSSCLSCHLPLGRTPTSQGQSFVVRMQTGPLGDPCWAPWGQMGVGWVLCLGLLGSRDFWGPCEEPLSATGPDRFPQESGKLGPD